MGDGNSANSAPKKAGVFILLLEITFLVLLGLFACYAPSADVSEKVTSKETTGQSIEFQSRYSMFQDVHIMIFIGFGFLMTFLRRYGYSAVGFNILLAALTIQWSIIIQGFIWMYDSQKLSFPVDIKSLISGDFAAAVILISFGVVLGKTSPLQLAVMAMIEVLFYATNIYIGENMLEATDAGGSMFIHTFGAYFGLTVSLVMQQKWYKEHPFEGSNYHSDLFAMIGSVFLWICWPSFNAALLTPGEEQHRTVINTYFSLCACVLSTFAVSMIVSRRAKFDMVHVQNATLAGGVAIGTMANFMIQPWCAGLMGLLAGLVSVIGYRFITPCLAAKLGLYDTCGVHNLHGMPGLLAGISGIVGAALAEPEIYGDNGLSKVFHGRAPDPTDEGLPKRTAMEQALMQAAALGITLGMAIIGGVITGILLRFLPCVDPVPVSGGFSDIPYWEIPTETDAADDIINEDLRMLENLRLKENALESF